MTSTNTQLEIWKDIPGYEGVYQISNLSRIKSLSRIILKNGKYPFKSKEKYLSKSIVNGYEHISLSSVKTKNYSVHQLVAMAFLNHTPCGYKLVVNHKNFNGLDNRLENLEIITQRENANHRKDKLSSKYNGVCFSKNDNKWKATIYVNGKNKHLGYFKTEIEASEYYQNALYSFKNNSEIISKPPRICSSKYVGVNWCNTSRKWKSRVYKNKKIISIGSYKTEELANLSRQEYLKNHPQ